MIEWFVNLETMYQFIAVAMAIVTTGYTVSFFVGLILFRGVKKKIDNEFENINDIFGR